MRLGLEEWQRGEDAWACGSLGTPSDHTEQQQASCCAAAAQWSECPMCCWSGSSAGCVWARHKVQPAADQLG